LERIFDLYHGGLALLLLSAVIGTIRYKNYKSRFSLFFLILLYIAVTVEAFGYYIWKINSSDNTWIYVIYIFFEFNLIFLMYHNILNDLKTKKLITILTVVFNISYFSIILYKGKWAFADLSTIESVILSVFLIAYLRELLNSDKILNFKKHLPFWVTTGFMIYFMSSIPFQYIRSTLKVHELTFVQPLINYFMYGCFIYAFLWSKKETSY